ncbi:MAG: glycoside hydrolase family 88 protein [Chitinophagaceae bacterium]
MKKYFFNLLVFLIVVVAARSQTAGSRMSETAMSIWADSFALPGDKFAKWRYDQGVILKGIEAVWNLNGDRKYFDYIRRSMDFYVDEDGTIRGYDVLDYNLDHLNNGRLLLTLFRVTKKEKYKKAADRLFEQLRSQPRNNVGGFWHKKIYPSQMWLDGLYMAAPFYAEYASLFRSDTTLDDITRQFLLVEKYIKDPVTGLYYHGWDESRAEKWASQQTGLSPNFWGRSLGWYGMALVDVLDYMPASASGRKDLIRMLRNFAAAVRKVQDKKTGLWYDLPTQPSLKGNYMEASASCMLSYMFAKGARMGYLGSEYRDYALQAYKGILKTFIEEDSAGKMSLIGTVGVSGLGGKPYRDGSVAYYLSEKQVVNDPKGVGAFILCATEMEMDKAIAGNKKVVLDYYYNREWETDKTGQKKRFHYTWEDRSNSGYAMLGQIFRSLGAQTTALESGAGKLKSSNAGIYIIVDPDTKKETDEPNYISAADAQEIRSWVKQGGVLVLLGNDAGNAEFTHFNQLAGLFGIRFNEDSKNRVQNDQFEQGVVKTPEGSKIFGSVKKLFIKEFSSLALSLPAIPVLTNGSDTVMAISRYGKGVVLAMGDPWIYNEYLDGRKLTPDFQNYPATVEWARWLLGQAGMKKN